MKNRSTRPRLLFLILGALLLLVSYLVTDQAGKPAFWPSIIQNVALVVLTVVIIEFLWSIVGGDPVNTSIMELRTILDRLRDSVRLLDDSHKTGLRRVHGTSSSAGSSLVWMDRLLGAKKAIDLMGYSLHIWTKSERFENTLAQLANSGVRVRILLMWEKNRVTS